MRILAAIILLAICAFGQNPSGERIYKGKCANCHSVDGSAGSELGRRLKLRDLRSPEVQQLSDKNLAELIGKGRGNMPSFQRQLKGDQLNAVVEYLRSLRRTDTANALTSAESQQGGSKNLK